MTVQVHSVAPGSLAGDMGIVSGDVILRINGRDDLEDLFDWQAEVTAPEAVSLWLRHPDGSEEIIDVEKDEDEDLGITLTSPVFTPIKTCNNACPFCFIDQQPDGLRPSLYVKDDDYRLSYFNNTYITLTNLTDRDRARIERIRPGPLYVSVHATNPEVRRVLLKNPKAAPVMDSLRWLKSLEIPFHCQVVLCPGINDGAVLTQTLTDLATLRPEALSVAVVPVGLTQYRSDLPDLTPVDPITAAAVIGTVEAFRRDNPKAGEDFVYLSDEFYMKAGLPFPTYGEYGGFPQLDDGVGTARMLTESFAALEATLPAAVTPQRNVMLLTGRLGAMVLAPIASRLNAVDGLYVDVVTVESRFWGQAVDVAGLMTGQDVLDTLRAMALSGYTHAVLPSVMLKEDRETFLDDRTVSELSEILKLPLVVVADSYSAEEMVRAVMAQPARVPVSG
ncbi:MAG: DUF512 domain-containing protein [Candidatus Melainabacteria bacterium]